MFGYQLDIVININIIYKKNIKLQKWKGWFNNESEHEFFMIFLCCPVKLLEWKGIIREIFLYRLGNIIYTDSYFTSLGLLQSLLADTIYCCGTVRRDRKGWPAAMKEVIEKEPGSYKTMQLDGVVSAYTWNDKCQVHILSTASDPTVESTIRRKNKDGTIRELACPPAVKEYSRFMNGVDRADQLRVLYSCTVLVSTRHRQV